MDFPLSLSAGNPNDMQRIQAIPRNALAGLSLLVWGCSLSLPVATAQDFAFQSPPLAPLSPVVASLQDPQVRPTDFQSAAANTQALALEPVGAGTLGSPTSAPTPLASAIREFIEPENSKTEQRTSASLFNLSALQLDNIDWKKMVFSLAIVIGGYLGLVLLMRMWNPQAAGALPREVVEVLGTSPLNSKQNLQLVRLGSKLLLLIHGPEGTQSLGEISNPNEVEHLAQVCCQRRGRKAPTTFRKFGEAGVSRDPQPNMALDTLLKNLQIALQRSPGRTEYEA